MTLEYYEPKDIVGKAVYDGRGQKIGEVEKAVFLRDGKGAMILRETKKIIVMEKVQSVADIILIPPTEEKELPPASLLTSPKVAISPKPVDISAAPATRICPKCKHDNKPTADFCVKCGAKL